MLLVLLYFSVTSFMLLLLLLLFDIFSFLADVPRAAFYSLAHIVNRMHELKLPMDKHSRDAILASYIQYVFCTPQGPGSSNFDTRQTTNQRSSRLFSDDEIYPRRSASLRQKHSLQQRTYSIHVHVHVYMYVMHVL